MRTRGAFIKVMREIGEEYNTKDEPCPYFSPDEFIKGGLKKATDNCDIVTAQSFFLQKISRFKYWS